MPSKSKAQQRFMGMVHALNKGEMKPSDASPAVKKAAKSMDTKSSKKYASSTHKGKPEKVKKEWLVKTIKEFQSSLAPLVESMIKTTTSGFSVSGEENLLKIPTLYIGNHRDISLDPLFLNYSLFIRNMNTVRIAIGDNLLDKSFAEKLMRLNKSFVVHRKISGMKETYTKLKRLSAYIYMSLTNDQESIWIAQKEGRANDGNDFTEEAVLKMLYLDSRKRHSLPEWVSKVNLTPIVISYEFDPLDKVKATGWEGWEKLSQEENNQRDIKELVQGITGLKGRVHLHICKSLRNFSGEMNDLVRVIDDKITNNFKLWPINHIAAFELSKKDSRYEIYDKSVVTKEEIQKVTQRFNGVEADLRKKILTTYAAPLLNK